MDLRNETDIEKLNDRLTKVVESEWGGLEGAYATVEEIKIDYTYSINTTCKIKFGRNLGIKNEANWEKELEIYLISDDLEFIAGQFTQAIIDKSL